LRIHDGGINIPVSSESRKSIANAINLRTLCATVIHPALVSSLS
jgi:hypothetical protein